MYMTPFLHQKDLPEPTGTIKVGTAGTPPLKQLKSALELIYISVRESTTDGVDYRDPHLKRAEKSSLRRARLVRHVKEERHVRGPTIYIRLALSKLTHGECVRRKKE